MAKGNALTTTQRRQRHQVRLDWLRAPDQTPLLARLPGATDDVDEAASDALDEAVRKMMHLRLFAPTSARTSVRHGIRLLVSELRGAPHPEWARK